jgi:hypothetical protein
MNPSIDQPRDHQLEFTIPDERVASDNRQVQGLKPVDDFEDTVYELLPLAITKTSQSHPSSQVRVIIGIASGTTQRAFAGNLNGKRGPLSYKNLAPSSKNF